MAGFGLHWGRTGCIGRSVEAASSGGLRVWVTGIAERGQRLGDLVGERSERGGWGQAVLRKLLGAEFIAPFLLEDSGPLAG